MALLVEHFHSTMRIMDYGDKWALERQNQHDGSWAFVSAAISSTQLASIIQAQFATFNVAKTSVISAIRGSHPFVLTGVRTI